jgi:uncharacterized membrane protein YhaH (DUF805 family)
MDTSIGPSSPVDELQAMAAAVGFRRLCVLASVFSLRVRRIRDSKRSNQASKGLVPEGNDPVPYTADRR